MKKRTIFVICSYFIDVDSSKILKILNYEYNVIVLDCSGLFPIRKKGLGCVKKSIHYSVISIKNYFELISLKKEFSPFCFISFFQYSFYDFFLRFFLFGEIVVSVNDSLTYTSFNSDSQKNRFNLKVFGKKLIYIVSRFFDVFYKKKLLISSVNYTKVPFFYDILLINDWNLEYIPKVKNNIDFKKTVLIVLNNFLFSNYDFLNYNSKLIDASSVLNKLRDFFHRLSLNYNVVISVHPKTNVNYVRDLFSDKFVYIHSTGFEDLEKSDFVLGFLSNVFIKSLLLNKTTFWISISEFKSSKWLNDAFKNWEDQAGIKSLDLDMFMSNSSLKLENLIYDNEKREDFINKFIPRRSSLSNKEIILNRFRNLI